MELNNERNNKMPLPNKHRSPLRCKDNNMILIKIALFSVIIIQFIYSQCNPEITKESLNSFDSKILFWKCPENRTLKDFEQMLFISNKVEYALPVKVFCKDALNSETYEIPIKVTSNLLLKDSLYFFIVPSLQLNIQKILLPNNHEIHYSENRSNISLDSVHAHNTTASVNDLSDAYLDYVKTIKSDDYMPWFAPSLGVVFGTATFLLFKYKDNQKDKAIRNGMAILGSICAIGTAISPFAIYDEIRSHKKKQKQAKDLCRKINNYQQR